ncbi:MAG: CHASE domain-containing protein, partial [Gammaproteobacteria bacterium]
MPDIVTRNIFPIVVLLTSLALSAGLWQYAKNVKQREMQNTFYGNASELVDHLQQRMLTYQQTLRGLRAFFNSSSHVTRDEFHNYIASLQILEQYPGIQGLSFVQMVQRNDLSKHIEEIRKQGFEDYTVYPESDREFYTPVVYIEPFTGRNLSVHGYDTFSEAVRRSAMVQSRDSGEAAVTGKLTLVQETGDQKQAGILMFLPLYVQNQPHDSLAQRRSSIYGWVTAVFRMGDLMSGLGHEHDGDHYHMHTSDLSIEIYDGDEESEQARMYQSSAFSSDLVNGFKRSNKIQVADHVWTSVIHARPSFLQRYDSRAPELVLITCIAFSLLLTLLVRALVRTRSMIDDVARSEERWRFALEGSGDGVWDWGLKNNEVKYSRRWKEMLGYQVGEVENTYMEWVKRVHPDDLPGAMEAIRAHIDDKTPAYSNEHRLQHKNRSWRWMLSRGVAVSRDESGRALRIIGTHTDITDRKLAEAALKEQRDFTDAVVEIAGHIIVVLDMSGCFVRLNRAAEELTGFRRDELLGKPVWDWVIPEEQIGGVKQVFENLKSGNVDVAARYENDWLTSDGSRITLDWYNTILRNAAGEITHIVTLGYDVTERKKAEENIRRLTRLYSTLSQCDHAIVHSSHEAELFPQVCMDVVKYGGFKMAWIGMLDDASQRVIPVASYGSGTEYLD